MIGSLRNHWIYTAQEIWESLATHEQAPQDFFSDLYSEVEDHLGVHTSQALFEEIRNDPVIAQTKFLAIKGTDFAAEMEIAKFLEEAYETIEDYGISGYGEKFKILLRSFLTKYNLRYRLDDPFALRFLLPGSFANLYNDLRRINITNVHLQTLWSDFEEAFDEYSHESSERKLNACLTNASKYAEGLASITTGKNGTLADLADQVNEWPHMALKQSLKNLYGFCSNYPQLRHAGNPASAIRKLDSRDSILISVLFVAFSGYLTTNLNKQEVLGA
jgi:hypothetical protein